MNYNAHDWIADFLYKVRAYRLAYWYAARYLPPHHPFNFDDEQGA